MQGTPERWGGGTATGEGRRARARSLIKAAAARGPITLPYLYPVAPQLSRLLIRVKLARALFYAQRQLTAIFHLLVFYLYRCYIFFSALRYSVTFLFRRFFLLLLVVFLNSGFRNSKRDAEKRISDSQDVRSISMNTPKRAKSTK